MEKRFFLVDNLAFSVDNPVDKCITMCEIAGVEHFFYFSRVFGEFRQRNAAVRFRVRRAVYLYQTPLNAFFSGESGGMRTYHLIPP